MTSTHLIGYCDHCGWPVAAKGITLTGDDASPRDGARSHRCDDTACVVSAIKTYSGQYHIVTMHDDTRHYVPVAEIDLAEIADDYASVDTVTGYLCRHDGGNWTPVDAESQDDAIRQFDL